MTEWDVKIEGCGPGLYLATARSTCGRFRLQAQAPTRLDALNRLRAELARWRREIDGVLPN